MFLFPCTRHYHLQVINPNKFKTLEAHKSTITHQHCNVPSHLSRSQLFVFAAIFKEWDTLIVLELIYLSLLCVINYEKTKRVLITKRNFYRFYVAHRICSWNIFIDPYKSHALSNIKYKLGRVAETNL